MGDFGTWIAVVVGLATLVNILYTWLSSRGKANSAEIDKIKEKDSSQDVVIGKLGERIDSIHNRVPELISEVRYVHQRMDSVGKEVSELKGIVGTLAESTKTLHDFLLNERRGGSDGGGDGK